LGYPIKIPGTANITTVFAGGGAALRTYFVSPESFRPYAIGTSYAPRIERAMTELVGHYEIKDKSILSLGGGNCRQEYFLTRFGNRLMVVDLDEHGDLEPMLAKAAPGNLRYVIGDALTHRPEEPVDVLFASGLTPDELRRSRIIRQRDTPDFRRMVDEHGAWDWPPWEPAFHPAMMTFAGWLKPSGLFIVQSFLGSLDVSHSKTYLPAADAQMAQAGLTLFEIYCLAETKGVMLYVAARGTPPAVNESVAITVIHGRGPQESVERVR
jgi:hypothetical protein